MTQDRTRTCPNCGTPLEPGVSVCPRCGTQLTVAISMGMGEPTLRVVPDSGRTSTFRLSQQTMTLGSAANQDIVLPFAGIAPQMVKLVQEGTRYRLFDLTSYPGDVMVNGKYIDSQLLRNGDTIRLQDGSGVGVTMTYANPLDESAEEDKQQFFPFKSFPFVIGRAQECTLVLRPLAVSWKHAEIIEQGKDHILQDAGSTNGTFVNDHRIAGPHRLRLDDVIRIDQTLLVYKGNGLLQLASLQRYQLDAVNLGMRYTTGVFQRQSYDTMREVSFSILPDELVAIIGGSGSGKSTLLRALNGANRATSGEVLINGDNLYTNYDEYQPIIGYVPQSDIVQNKLSVYESLYFGARLRFPNEPKDSREQRIARALDAVQMMDYRDRQVGKLSGGQKKRVSIALELMAEPHLLFMDEPSSGLDPGLDKSMMNTLRRLANRGNTVVVVTHTTLNIGICDKLAVMASGHLTYFGPPKESLNFFDVRDFTEIYNRVQQVPTGDPNQTITPREAAAKWAARFRQVPQFARYVSKQLLHPRKEAGQQSESEAASKRLRGQRGGSMLQQAQVLISRNLTLALRDFRVMLALLVVLPLVGLFLGFINWDSIENIRGQMLINRFAQTPLESFMDKIPLTSIDNPEAAAAPTPTPEPTPESSSNRQLGGSREESRGAPKVLGSAVYAPASDAQRLLFMLSLSVTLLGIFAAAYTIVEEKTLFLRERMSNLRVPPYLASKFVVYGALSLISAALAMLTLSIGVELPQQGLLTWGPLELFITLALTSLAGVSIGLLLSAINRQVNGVTYAVLAVLFVQILLPGVLFRMDGPLEVPSRLTITRWSLEALGATTHIVDRDAEGRFVIETQPVNRRGEPLQGVDTARQFYQVSSALNVTYPTDANGLLIRWGALATFSLVLLTGAGLALRRDESF